MKSNGSVYVAVVFVVLAGYFTYQWWFNPSRAAKQRLGEIAAALSVPAAEGDLARVERLAQLRHYLADDVRVDAGRGVPLVTSRDGAIAALTAVRVPPDGVDVQFVDTQLNVASDGTARAYVTVELTTADPQSRQPTVDSREAVISLARRNGEWLVTSAELPASPTRP